MRQRLKWTVIFSLLFLSSLLLLFTFNRGFTFHDEGYVVQAAERVLQGEIPYRDFYYIYTPVTVYLTVAAFKLFGVSLFAGRLVLLIFSIFTVFIVQKLFSRVSLNSLFMVLASLSYVAWGPAHINFIWPVIISLNLGLLTIYLAMLNQPFLAGIVAGLVFLAKQNLGLAVTATIALWLLLFDPAQPKRTDSGQARMTNKNFSLRSKNSLVFIKFVCGVVISLLFFGLYLWRENALFAFFDQSYQFVLRGKLLDRSVRLVFLEYGPWYKAVAKTLLYTSPLTSAALVLYKSWKKKLPALGLISLFTLFFYLANAWPDADYTHIAPTLGLAGINLLLLYELVSSSIKKRLIVWSFLGLSGVGIWSALFLGYYRWETPLFQTTTFLPQSRLNIYADDKYATILPAVIDYVNNNSQLNDYVFLYYNAPMFNFLVNRPNPTRGLDMTPGILPQPYGEQIIRDLQLKPPKLIITHWAEKDWQYTPIGRFITVNYILDYQIREIGLWKKK